MSLELWDLPLWLSGYEEQALFLRLVWALSTMPSYPFGWVSLQPQIISSWLILHWRLEGYPLQISRALILAGSLPTNSRLSGIPQVPSYVSIQETVRLCLNSPTPVPWPGNFLQAVWSLFVIAWCAMSWVPFCVCVVAGVGGSFVVVISDGKVNLVSVTPS